MLAFAKKVIRKASGTVIMGGMDDAGTGIHYAGTCRMSASASEGVVNGDLRAHDHDNLYICDGGVIPVLPDKHLTLTIMAGGGNFTGIAISMIGLLVCIVATFVAGPAIRKTSAAPAGIPLATSAAAIGTDAVAHT